jgi:DNA mismatch repair protein MutS2
LLWLSHQKSKKPVVPLDITLRGDQRILVISGPNAGGKSICLKTVGLLQIMVQCGLPIPVDEGSVVGIFQSLLVNIGDEQSIENDLSTYSSHLAAMKVFLAQANAETLFLIDEFGAGTEPQMGGAIAEAILEMLNNKKAFGVVTTHYTNLKKQADKLPGMVNGAMKYDIVNMEPLYVLEMGQPGSSFALEIAEKIGLPRAVVNLAKNKAGVKHVQLEEMLRNLEIEKKNTAEKLKELREREQWVNKLTADLESQKQKLAQTKEKWLNEARVEAKTLLDQANARIEQTIRDIKESQADKNVTRKLRGELNQLKQEVEKQLEPEKESVSVVSGELQVGDFVQIADTESFGQIQEMKDKEAIVSIGEIRTTVKKNRLLKISAKDFKKRTEGKSSRNTQTMNISERMMNFQMSIDLRGKRADEALNELDQWLDQAFLVGADRLRILHGKGDGILRKLVRNHLKGFKQVQEMADENPDRGGDGVTLVKLV